MTRLLTYGTLAACVLGVLGAVGQQQPMFRGESDAVRVFVTVTDGDGRLITTLTRDDFEVRDEGKSQPITLFDNTPQPVRLIVMLDVSGSMQGNLPLLRAAAEQLIARLGPDDLARVGAFGYEISLSPSFTRDPEELLRALPDAIAADAPTPLWRALDEAMNAFAAEGEGRPVILVLSDGKDSGPTSFGRHVASQGQVIDRARDDNLMVYAIGMRSRGPRPMRPGIGPAGLRAALLADMPDSGPTSHLFDLSGCTGARAFALCFVPSRPAIRVRTSRSSREIGIMPRIPPVASAIFVDHSIRSRSPAARAWGSSCANIARMPLYAVWKNGRPGHRSSQPTSWA